MDKELCEQINSVLGKKIFPLYTQRSLRERWGVGRNVITNRKNRDSDFPKPIQGLIVTGYNDGEIYPAYEVEQYERGENFNRPAGRPGRPRVGGKKNL